MSQTCRQKQTKKAATFDAVWRFSEHHAHPYVSGSDMKNVWDRWPHHDESSKGRAYCGVVVQNYPTKSNFVVLSHRHSDHTAGLNYVLSINPTVKIYAPKEGFGIYGSSLPSSFYRKDETLPPEMRYYGGTPPQVMKFGAAWRGANFELIDRTTESLRA